MKLRDCKVDLIYVIGQSGVSATNDIQELIEKILELAGPCYNRRWEYSSEFLEKHNLPKYSPAPEWYVKVNGGLCTFFTATSIQEFFNLCNSHGVDVEI